MKQVYNFVTKNQIVKLALQNKLVPENTEYVELHDRKSVMIETYKRGKIFYHLVFEVENNEIKFLYCVQCWTADFNFNHVVIVAARLQADNKKYPDLYKMIKDIKEQSYKIYYYGC